MLVAVNTVPCFTTAGNAAPIDVAEFLRQRYSSWDSGIGAKIEAGKSDFKELEAYMLKKGDISPNTSGRQEMLENLINEFI